jgi:hypothetical protein
VKGDQHVWKEFEKFKKFKEFERGPGSPTFEPCAEVGSHPSSNFSTISQTPA